MRCRYILVLLTVLVGVFAFAGGYQTVALLLAPSEVTGTFKTESEFDDGVSESTDLLNDLPEENETDGSEIKADGTENETITTSGDGEVLVLISEAVFLTGSTHRLL